MSGRRRHNIFEVSYALELQKEKHWNEKTWQGFGLSWACGHGQHALDEHDRDTPHAQWTQAVSSGIAQAVVHIEAQRRKLTLQIFLGVTHGAYGVARSLGWTVGRQIGHVSIWWFQTLFDSREHFYFSLTRIRAYWHVSTSWLNAFL